ncbi:MAG: N-acetylmuramoyl-L-alanine amidase [Bacillota bacterium]|nr:N-acetylmuramoyl-L-alanine amidase [Bacillota bacterium]
MVLVPPQKLFLGFLLLLLVAVLLDGQAQTLEASGQGKATLRESPFLQGKRILLDPGHGGDDPGAVQNGIRESDLNGDIAQQLARFLEEAGAEVLFTRVEGGPVPSPRERIQLMESLHPDIIVSIHCNAFPSPIWRGAQTFYNPEAKDPRSRELALHIQETLRRLTPTTRHANRGINHYILKAAQVPAVTVELGFLTNPEDLELLQSASYRRRAAFAIFLGIAHFFAQSPLPAGEG